jgi:hypothetical protein
MRKPLLDSIAELEGGYTPKESAEDFREDLHGFWKLLVTTEEIAAAGFTGFGSEFGRSLVGSPYICYTKGEAYSGEPTSQIVEVVSDHLEGKSVVAALKGDFEVGKLASTKKLGVNEFYTRKELDGERMETKDFSNMNWSCAFMDDHLRVLRTEQGETMVLGKMESAAAAQKEIGELMSAPVKRLEGMHDADAYDKDDDRPLWQKRLDQEERESGYNRFGPPDLSGEDYVIP